MAQKLDLPTEQPQPEVLDEVFDIVEVNLSILVALLMTSTML